MKSEQVQALMQQLLQTQTSFRQAIQRSLRTNNVDMTFEMLQIMRCLWRKQGVNQQELAANTFKDKVSLTYLINNLEKKGWVERKEDPIDRRNRQIYLTPTGEYMKERVMPLLQDLYCKSGESTETRHTEQCIDYLKEINDVFKKL